MVGLHRSLCALYLFIALTSSAVAQKIKTVEATYTYHATENLTVEQAKRKALLGAQLDAIAEHFGTTVSQQTSLRTRVQNAESQEDMFSLSESDVKGEWIETIGEPRFTVQYDEGTLVVTCTVRGKIREIKRAEIDLHAAVLRNGLDDRFEATEFKSGDDLFLSFQSPVSGSLAVYLVDASGQAFCLLPYQAQTDGAYRVKANKRYVFFSSQTAPEEERATTDEYTLTCDGAAEDNQVVCIFSPNIFAKANDTDSPDGLLRSLSAKDFQKWLSRVRTKDAQAQVRTFYITINP